MKTTLASGAWIEHTPIGDLKGKHRRTMDRIGKPKLDGAAVSSSGDVDVAALLAGFNVMQFSAAKRDGLWALLISGWSYDTPVPKLEDTADGELVVTGADAFDDLPLDDYDEIDRILAPYGVKLNRRADPKGSTTSGSNGLSPAKANGSRKD